ncbi:MAG: hypothetical protein GY804_02680 [Alphaproteobacteria bacterium]|nr:hypothetical protein [Alphaproteobacteria bacterium]
MSKSIIEKLGITPGPWRVKNGWAIFGKDKKKPLATCNECDSQLIAAAPELLDSLIKRVSNECDGCNFNLCSTVGCLAYEEKTIIEKTCYPKKWEEIRSYYE